LIEVIPREVEELYIIGPMRIFTARKNQTLALTSRQEELVLGAILGDAYIHPKGKIQIEHSQNQKEYVFWKYKELSTAAYGCPSRIARFNRKSNKTYNSYRFWLRQYFRCWRELFYPHGKKIVPPYPTLNLSPLSLAVWYMDDGNIENRYIRLAVDCFDPNSCDQAQMYLRELFGLKSRLINGPKLVLSGSEADKFLHLVEPYIIPSMQYKLL